MLNRKDQLLKAAYYDVARNETKVTHYLSKSIVDQSRGWMVLAARGVSDGFVGAWNLISFQRTL